MKDWNMAENKTIVRGHSFKLIDSEGTAYLDGIANMWCNVWGHGHNPVTRAIIKQFEKLPHSTLFGLASEEVVKASSSLIRMAKGMDKVFYTDNGSSAIEAALKMALQFWHNRGQVSKVKFVSVEHGYHGDTAGAMSVGYIDQFFDPYKPMLHECLKVPSPGSAERYTIKDEKYDIQGPLESAERLLSSIADECAAFVMESGAQIAGGGLIYPPGYQEGIANLCRKYGILLILDERATGFGRLGNMVEYIEQNSIPDIVCFGKALTGGYFPMAVTLAKRDIFNAFLGEYAEGKHFYHGHTFTGHAAGCAATCANIELYKKRQLIAQIKKNARYLESRLVEFEQFSVVSSIRHKGLFAAVELNSNSKPPMLNDGRLMNYFIMKRALELGVFLRPLGNNLFILPPLAMPQSDIGRVVDASLKIVSELEDLVK